MTVFGLYHWKVDVKNCCESNPEGKGKGTLHWIRLWLCGLYGNSLKFFFQVVSKERSGTYSENYPQAGSYPPLLDPFWQSDEFLGFRLQNGGSSCRREQTRRRCFVITSLHRSCSAAHCGAVALHALTATVIRRSDPEIHLGHFFTYWLGPNTLFSLQSYSLAPGQLAL